MDLSKYELLRQGAEAKLYRGTYLSREAVIKERFPKSYRLPELDTRLTKERTKAEAKALIKCKALGIRTPTLYLVDQNLIFMEYLACPTARDFIKDILADNAKSSEEQKETLTKLGTSIGLMMAKLHNHNVVHGDMTTSNLLVTDSEKGEICVIDFGLANTEGSAEDKGVDMYVLERAIISAHPNTEYMFESIMQSYEQGLENKIRGSLMKKYHDIRLRGRKRDAIG